MSVKTENTELIFEPVKRDEGYLRLRMEIEEFLYDEAELLDTRQFDAWLATLEEDLTYFMPMMSNVKAGEHDEREFTRFEKDISWFNEGKWTLTKRVEQIQTGVHWAEEPLSRLNRLVSNVQVTGQRINQQGQKEVQARSRLILYQNRTEYEQYFFSTRRYDVLRQVEGEWKLARREIQLLQSVLLAKNLTMFF